MLPFVKINVYVHLKLAPLHKIKLYKLKCNKSELMYTVLFKNLNRCGIDRLVTHELDKMDRYKPLRLSIGKGLTQRTDHSHFK